MQKFVTDLVGNLPQFGIAEAVTDDPDHDSKDVAKLIVYHRAQDARGEFPCCLLDLAAQLVPEWLHVRVLIGNVDMNDRYPLLRLALNPVELGNLLDLLLDFVSDQLFDALGTGSGKARHDDRGANSKARVFGTGHIQVGGHARDCDDGEGRPCDSIALDRGAR